MRIFTDSDHVLTMLDEVTGISDHYYLQTNLDISGMATKAGVFNPNDTRSEEIEPNDPWCSFCPDFWIKAIMDPNTRP